jgi:hypothetical protein
MKELIDVIKESLYESDITKSPSENKYNLDIVQIERYTKTIIKNYQEYLNYANKIFPKI